MLTGTHQNPQNAASSFGGDRPAAARHRWPRPGVTISFDFPSDLDEPMVKAAFTIRRRIAVTPSISTM